MKILSTTLMVLALSLGHFLFAQEPVYNWGEPNTDANLEYKIEKVLNLGDKGFAILRSKPVAGLGKGYWIEEYDENLKLEDVHQVTFNGGFMGDSYDIVDIRVSNGVIYAFVEHWHKDYGHNTISVRELSVQGALTEIADLDIINAQKMMNRGHHEFSFSQDGSKLIVLSEMPRVKKSNETFRITCFEVDGMKKLWSHEKETTWPSEKSYNNEIVVNNKGQALLFKRTWMKPEWKYSIYTIGESGDLEENNDLQLVGREIEDYQLKFNEQNELVIFGTVTNKGSNYEKRIHGSWFAKYDADMKMEAIRHSDWDASVLTQVGGERLASKSDAYLNNFRLKDVLFRADGNVLVLLEELRTKRDALHDRQPVQYKYTWFYGGVLTLALNPSSGETLWTQFLDKEQETTSTTSSDDEHGSFVYHLKENRLFILWNNTKLSIPSVPAANWTEPDGTKYVKRTAFDEKTSYATFMHVIEPDGSMAYANRKFGLPLFSMHAGAVFEMSMSGRFFFELDGVLVLKAVMNNGGKRYRFGYVDL